MALGIPFGTLIVVIILLSGGDVFGTDAKYALFMILLLFALTYLMTLIIYGGKYAPGFIVDKEGVTNYTQAGQAKKNKGINTLLIVFGLFNGNFSAAGAGVLAQSRQVVRVKWKNVRYIRYYPRQSTMMIKGGFAEKIAVFCTKENYEDVAQAMRKYLDAAQKKSGSKKKRHESKNPDNFGALYIYLGVLLIWVMLFPESEAGGD